jgi:hypothetical protein
MWTAYFNGGVPTLPGKAWSFGQVAQAEAAISQYRESFDVKGVDSPGAFAATQQIMNLETAIFDEYTPRMTAQLIADYESLESYCDN